MRCISCLALATFGISVAYLIPVMNGYLKTWCSNPYTGARSGVCEFQGLLEIAVLFAKLSYQLILSVFLNIILVDNSLADRRFQNDAIMLIYLALL